MAGEVGALRITLGINSGGVTQELSQVNKRLAALNQEFRAVSTGSARFDNSLEALRVRSDVLTRTMSTHRTKVEELRRKYEESKATKGEDAAETLTLAAAYNRAVAAMNRTEEQLTNVNSQIQQQTSEFGQLSQAVNQSVSNITQELRLLESGFNASTSGIENFGSEVEHLQQQQQHLNQTFSLQQQRVEELARLHRASAEATGENSEETQELQLRLNGAIQAMNETQQQLNATTSSLEEQSNVWNKLAQNVEATSAQIQETGQQWQTTGQALTAGITLPLVGFGAAAVKVADDFDSSSGRIEARLGVTAERAEELGNVAEDVWENAFGESVREVGDAITVVSNNLKGISDEELKSATESAYFLADAFDADINESTRAAGQLMKDFGDSSGKAFDLLTFGFQNGLDFTGEFLDTLREYAPQFSELGYTSEQFMNTLKTGFDAGAWSLDKIGDSIKESHLRMGDLADSTVEAYKAMGLNAEEYVAKINKGGEEGNKAFQEIVKGLMKVDDETERNTLSVALFGTQYEDLREKVIFSMAGASKSIEGLEGTTKRASDAIYDNFGSKLTTVFRGFQDDLEPIGEDLIEIAEDVLPVLADTVGNVTSAFAEMDPSAQKTALAVGAVAAAAGPVIFSIGTLVTGVGALTGAVTPLITAIGAGGLAGGLAALTGPVGLTVAGLGLAAGAVYAVKTAIDDSKDVNLEYATSLVNQHTELNKLIPAYESLREKNELSNYELLRFRDIQDELQTAKSADEIKKLKDEAEKLREKSGLSNEQLSEMLSLNDQLIERVPEAGQAFSEQGNSILKNTDDINLANEALRENLQLELDIQRTKLEANLDGNIRKQIEATQELNEKVIELNNAKIEGAAQEYQLEQLKKQQQDAYAAGQDHIAEGMALEIEQLEAGINKQNNKVTAVASEVQEKQKAVEKTQEEITKTQTLFDEMINLQLAQAGINTKGQEGINQLGQAISKTQARIGELNNVKREQGGLNEAQQKELDNLNSALGKHRQAQQEIRGIQSEQNAVNSKIDAGKRKAGDMSDVLSKSEIKNIKFTGDGYSKAKIISDESARDVLKEVNVTDYGKANTIHKNAEKDASKTVTISAVVTSGFKTAVRAFEKVSGINIPGFAKGTNFAPGGLALVGEEGPELINLPRGSQVFTNSKTKEMMGSISPIVGGYAQQDLTPLVNAINNLASRPISVAVNEREIITATVEGMQNRLDFNSNRKRTFNRG